jgi:hypothetical protein
MLTEDNQRIHVQPWATGPGYRYNAKRQSMDIEVDQHDNNVGPTQSDILYDDEFTNQEDVRMPLREEWQRYYRHVASHIPYAACRLTPDIEMNDDDDDGVESIPTSNPGNTPQKNTKGKLPQGQGGRPSC